MLEKTILVLIAMAAIYALQAFILLLSYNTLAAQLEWKPVNYLTALLIVIGLNTILGGFRSPRIKNEFSGAGCSMIDNSKFEQYRDW